VEKREASVVGRRSLDGSVDGVGGGWGGGVRRGDGICALGRIAEERGAEPCTTGMWTPTLLS
jgi:hypothetical protein